MDIKETKISLPPAYIFPLRFHATLLISILSYFLAGFFHLLPKHYFTFSQFCVSSWNPHISMGIHRVSPLFRIMNHPPCPHPSERAPIDYECILYGASILTLLFTHYDIMVLLLFLHPGEATEADFLFHLL
jgi:hypothetical protein